jgi:hypothetical protein
MIGEWRSSAKILIYHYRSIIRGMLPFYQDWTPKMQEDANLDDESLEFVKKICEIVAHRRE